jgi:hypothetical protein
LCAYEVAPQGVIAEWLYQLGEKRERVLFTRSDAAIKVNARNFREGRGLEQRTRGNALFLSVVAQFNGPVASLLLRWFANLTIASGVANDQEYALSVRLNRDTPYHPAIEQRCTG